MGLFPSQEYAAFQCGCWFTSTKQEVVILLTVLKWKKKPKTIPNHFSTMGCISTSSHLMFEQSCNQKLELLSWTEKDKTNTCSSYCQSCSAYRFKYRNRLFCGIYQCQSQKTSTSRKTVSHWQENHRYLMFCNCWCGWTSNLIVKYRNKK